jgi:hypothetical protein
MDPTLYLAIVFSVPALALLFFVLRPAEEWLAVRAGEFRGRCEEIMEGWRHSAALRSLHRQARDFVRQAQAAEEHHRRAFLNWLDAQMGPEPVAEMTEEQLVEAQRQSRAIHLLLDQELPHQVGECLQLHKNLPQALGIRDLAHLACEPDAYSCRRRTIWLLFHTVKYIERYPLLLKSRALIQNAAVLRDRALPTCRCCPLLHGSPDQIPDLCPTARLFMPGPAHEESH